MFLLAKYGTQTTFTFPMVKRGAVDLAVTADWTPAATDSSICKDGGNYADTTNTIAIAGTSGTRGAVGWKITLTASELTGGVIDLQIVDAVTKAVEDQFIKIYTYGNASAKIQVDLSDTVRMGLTALPNATAGASTGLPLSADASGRVDVLKINGTSQTARDIGASVLVGDKTGFSLTAGEETAIASAVWQRVEEGSLTAENILRIIMSACAGKADGFPTATNHYRDQGDTKNRITATTDVNGNRTAITVDGT